MQDCDVFYMITENEAEVLLKGMPLHHIASLDGYYTSIWFSGEYFVTRDKCDFHLAMLMRRKNNEILYACKHTQQGAQILFQTNFPR